MVGALNVYNTSHEDNKEPTLVITPSERTHCHTISSSVWFGTVYNKEVPTGTMVFVAVSMALRPR